MPLSDQEIKELLEKAESCIKSFEVSKTFKDNVRFLKEAIECYDQIIENAPPHPYYFAKRADIKHMMAYNSGSYELYLNSAIEDMNRAIELEPDKGEYHRLRGRYLLSYLSIFLSITSVTKRNQLLEKVIVDYKACIEKDPSDAKVWLGLIGVNIVLKNWDDAISAYGSCRPYISTKEERLIRAWLGCLALAFVGDPIEEEDIKPLYDQTIKLEFDSSLDIVSIFVGEIYEGKNNEEKLKRAKEINELFIDHFYNWDTKAIFFKQLGFYEEALKAYDKAIEQNPNDDGMRYNKAILLRQKLNRYAEALQAIDKVIDLNPLHSKAWQEKGFVLSELGRNEEAIEAYNKAIELNPYDSNLWIKKGLSLHKLGCLKETVEAFEKSLELNPHYEKLRSLKEGILRQLGRYKDT